MRRKKKPAFKNLKKLSSNDKVPGEICKFQIYNFGRFFHARSHLMDLNSFYRIVINYIVTYRIKELK